MPKVPEPSAPAKAAYEAARQLDASCMHTVAISRLVMWVGRASDGLRDGDSVGALLFHSAVSRG